MAVSSVCKASYLTKGVTRKHVMRDLQPYVCTFPNCDLAHETFPSLNQYLVHEIRTHELGGLEGAPSHDNIEGKAVIRKMRKASVVCLFCGDRTEEGSGHGSRGRHVGRHMEEIAFTVVSKGYEEWEFYSDSSSARSDLMASERPAKLDMDDIAMSAG